MKLGLFRKLFRKEPEEDIPLNRRAIRPGRTRSNINQPPKEPRPSPPPPPLQSWRPNGKRHANTSGRGAEEHF
jgi:hypothetical protein